MVSLQTTVNMFESSALQKTGGSKIEDLFSTTSQLNGKFEGQYLRQRAGYRQSGKALKTTKGFLHFRQISRTWLH